MWIRSTFQRSPILRNAVALVLPLCVLLLCEGASRIGAYLWHGHSEYYLYYGFHSYVGRVGINPWWTDTGRHYKFPPRYVLKKAAGQAGETATINSLGFRGPEFEPVKRDGTFRVVCLGESSTFGFHNGDAETYPYLLQKLFEQRHGAGVEVINAGFPYYNSGSILSLLQSEILSYDPDVLTIYSAYNDASWPLHVGSISRLASWFQEHSMLYLLMKQNLLTDEFVVKWNGRISRRLLRQNNHDAFRAQLPQVAARYRRNIEAIIAAAGARGIPVVFIKQPMTSRFTEVQNSEYSKTYEEEYREVKRRFEANADLSPVEFQLLSQHRVVEELEALSKERNVQLVDNAALVDEDRRLMASYVHLTAQANERLAKALQPVIERYLPKPGQ